MKANKQVQEVSATVSDLGTKGWNFVSGYISKAKEAVEQYTADTNQQTKTSEVSNGISNQSNGSLSQGSTHISGNEDSDNPKLESWLSENDTSKSNREMSSDGWDDWKIEESSKVVKQPTKNDSEDGWENWDNHEIDEKEFSKSSKSKTKSQKSISSEGWDDWDKEW